LDNFSFEQQSNENLNDLTMSNIMKYVVQWWLLEMSQSKIKRNNWLTSHRIIDFWPQGSSFLKIYVRLCNVSSTTDQNKALKMKEKATFWPFGKRPWSCFTATVDDGGDLEILLRQQPQKT
jgi:hypothetical protein